MAGAHGAVSLLLLGACSLVAVAGSAAAAPEPCAVDLAVNEQEVHVSITSTNPGAASATGTVTTDMPPLAERGVVSITGSVSTGWPLSISPQTYQVSGNAGLTTTFHITVVVPPGTPVSSGVVTVVARMTAGGVQCDSDPVDAPTVIVRPYVEELSLATDQSLYSVTGPGHGRTITVALGSRANTGLEGTVSYVAPEGITVTGPLSLDVGWSQNGTANTTFTVRLQSAGEQVGTFPVEITVHVSAGDGAQAESSLRISFAVTEAPIPGAGAPGALAVLLGVAAGALLRQAGGRPPGGVRSRGRE